jgi:hypothetical protein
MRSYLKEKYFQHALETEIVMPVMWVNTLPPPPPPPYTHKRHDWSPDMLKAVK